MKQNKLIQRLKKLNKQEWKQFVAYVNSPFFKIPKGCSPFINLIEKEHPTFLFKKLPKEVIAAKVFPKAKNSLGSLDTCLSNLGNVLDKFLIQIEWESSDDYKAHYLLKQLEMRGSKIHWAKKIKNAHSKLNEFKEQGIDYFYKKYLLEERLYKSTIYQQDKKYESNIHTLFRSFDIYAALNKLSYWCTAINHSQIVNMEALQLEEIEALFKHIEKHDLTEIPAVKIYTIALQLKIEETEPFYQLLQNSLLEHENKLPKAEYRDLVNIASNYCIQKIIQGQNNYLLKLFDWYQVKLEKKMLYDGRFIPSKEIKNIVSIGCKLKKFDWTRQFIVDYKNKVSEAEREDLFNFNFGALNFYMQNYGLATTHLLRVNRDDFYYALDVQALLLKAYYQSDETDLLLSLSDSFKMYIHNKKSKIAATQCTVYNNFRKFAVRLYKLKGLYNSTAFEKLNAQITASKAISDKQWLLEKIKELESLKK